MLLRKKTVQTVRLEDMIGKKGAGRSNMDFRILVIVVLNPALCSRFVLRFLLILGPFFAGVGGVHGIKLL